MGASVDNTKEYIKELLKINKKNLVALGYQKITVDGTVKSLTIPTNATYALMVLDSSLATAAIRYLELGAGSPPSSTDGLTRFNTDAWDVHGYQNLTNFRITQAAAGTHTLHVQYYK